MALGLHDVELIGISGSLRTGSMNTAVLETLRERIEGSAILTLIPLTDIPLYNADIDGDEKPAPVRRLRDAISSADGLVIASPEYNNGISGVLKNAIDWASRPQGLSPLRGKPVLVMTTSPGALGGVRAYPQIQDTLMACRARVVTGPQVAITHAHQKIQAGRLAHDDTIAFALKAIDVLIDEIRLLRRAGL